MPATATTLRDELIASGLATLDLARSVTDAMLEGLTDDQLTHRVCPTGQHALHIMGHLVFADAMTLGLDTPDAAALPEGFNEAFGMGATIKDHASDYPPVDQVRAHYAQKRDALKAWFSSLDDAALTAPLEGNWAQFGRNRAHLAQTLAWHEGTHTGQLSQIRRSLGLPHKF